MAQGKVILSVQLRNGETARYPLSNQASQLPWTINVTFNLRSSAKGPSFYEATDLKRCQKDKNEVQDER